MVNRTMGKTGQEHRKISLRVFVSRWVILLFLLCLFVIFLYIAGSSQGFLDSTQHFILNLVSILGIFLVTGALFGFFYSLFLFFKRAFRSRHLFGALFYLFITILGAAASLSAMTIITASGGNA